jgi:hypothetical protein
MLPSSTSAVAIFLLWPESQDRISEEFGENGGNDNHCRIRDNVNFVIDLFRKIAREMAIGL